MFALFGVFFFPFLIFRIESYLLPKVLHSYIISHNIIHKTNPNKTKQVETTSVPPTTPQRKQNIY